MFQTIYDSKKITVDEALDLVESNNNIVSALAGAEPSEFLSRLHERADKVNNVVVTTCLPMGKYEYFSDPKHIDSFRMDGWFYSAAMRKLHKNKNISYIPNHLHLSRTKRLCHIKPDIFVGTASSMDKHGYISLSLSATYELDMIKNADKVIIEVNPNMPRTFGDTNIHISDIDYVVNVDYEVLELPSTEPNDKDLQIGRIIANLIEDGSTLQLGIGGIPNAVAASLSDKKDLGIHTEMFTDGMVDLVKSGVITGKNKSLYPGKMVATFALGTKKLYDFIDDNPAVLIMEGKWVNDPYVIGKNTKMVSINTTLEVDLTGQCCSESIGSKQFSGTGGQADTAIGAQNSVGGKSIIALYSTAMVRQPDGTKKEVSKIVPTLKEGAGVTLSRNDVDYVVTEYGCVSLRGTSIRDRVEKLISISHPKFREELKELADKIMLW